ncbi:MAG: HlyC/CorC family transporter [Chlamydiia bacterium]|nr:HlyC/CorC family transporter [Chlamydiia bacterium]
MIALLAYFFGSHLISFSCSIFEAVLLSCNDPFVVILKKKGSSAGGILEELRAKIDRPLAAILTLNTIAHTFGAAGVGAMVVELYGNDWLALASVVVTLTMLYFTEMIPKTLGAIYWKKLAPICVYPIKWLIGLTYPFVLSFQIFSRFFSRGRKKDKITEEEILVALETGAKAGVIEEAEQEMVENIFRLGDRHVGVLMRPRVDMEWLDIKDSEKEIRGKMIESEQDHFPVCEGEIDRVIGMVDAKTMLLKAFEEEKFEIQEVASPPIFVQENQRVFELIDLLKKKHSTMALVADEYGSIQGMITITDIMGAITKDIETSTLEEGGGILKVDNHSWIADGNLPIDEFNDHFHLENLPDWEKARYRTLSGLAMNQLGAIPKKGDIFFVKQYRCEVIKTKRRRAKKVLISIQDIIDV